jgi:hypothetical protein
VEKWKRRIETDDAAFPHSGTSRSNDAFSSCSGKERIMENIIIPRRRNGEMKRFAVHPGILVCLVVFALGVSCASVGRDFPSASVPGIQIGKTTQADIQSMFGPPWRVGIEDGQRTWTYGKYHYRLFGQSDTKDLVIRFNANNVVVSYSFNTTEREE